MRKTPATRVHAEDYTLTTCPVCELPITGTLTVEVRLGAVTVRPGSPTGDSKPTASVEVETKMRSLAIAHDCRAVNVAEPEAGDPGLEGQPTTSNEQEQ